MGEGCRPSSVLPEYVLRRCFQLRLPCLARDLRQVAVVRVDETLAGDSSGQVSPCATQNRHRQMDIYELPDSLTHTVVEGALLAQKLQNHLRCWFLIMLTLLPSMLLFRTL